MVDETVDRAARTRYVFSVNPFLGEELVMYVTREKVDAHRYLPSRSVHYGEPLTHRTKPRSSAVDFLDPLF